MKFMKWIYLAWDFIQSVGQAESKIATDYSLHHRWANFSCTNARYVGMFEIMSCLVVYADLEKYTLELKKG